MFHGPFSLNHCEVFSVLAELNRLTMNNMLLTGHLGLWCHSPGWHGHAPFPCFVLGLALDDGTKAEKGEQATMPLANKRWWIFNPCNVWTSFCFFQEHSVLAAPFGMRWSAHPLTAMGSCIGGGVLSWGWIAGIMLLVGGTQGREIFARTPCRANSMD